LKELGFDSLMAVELRNVLATRFAMTLPARWSSIAPPSKPWPAIWMSGSSPPRRRLPRGSAPTIRM